MNREEVKQLKKGVTPFEKSDVKASVIQLLNTIPPFFILWFLAYQSLNVSTLLAVVVAIVAAGFLVRMFIIFHDCTHNSFFPSRKANDRLGTLLGIMTLFPYEKWKRDHNIHHASNGNLDKRGTGDIWVMTVDEYVNASFWQRLGYRLYRNPFVMFILGPLYLLLVSNRKNHRGAKRKERWNTHVTTISALIIYTLLIYVVGWQAFLIIQGTILFVAAASGIWLFYVQHQFEDAYFENKDEWNYVKAAIDGSSYYKLSKPLQWITGNIGFHHVHHLSPRVPNYHLELVHEMNPPLHEVTTITLRSSLKSLRFRLYDEERKVFVRFRDLKDLSKQKRKAPVVLASRKMS